MVLMLTSVVYSYLPGPDDTLVLDIAYNIYTKFGEYASALFIALRLDNTQVRYYNSSNYTSAWTME